MRQSVALRMSVWGCGLNTDGQVLGGGPAILCCPSPISSMAGISAVNIALSHILWKSKVGWKWTGYPSCLPGEDHLSLDWKYFISENSIAAINSDGAAVKWDSGTWRAIYFQTEDDDDILTEDSDEVQNSLQSEGETECGAGVADVRKAEEKTTLRPYNKADSRLNEEKKVMKTKKIKVRGNKQDENSQCNSAGGPSLCDPGEDTSCSPKPKPIFVHLSLEDNVLLALDRDGTVYSGNVPVTIPVKISEVAVGKEHNIVLTANGVVFTWGSGMRGQLGIGELCQSEKPVTVESLEGITITAVGCGAWHCYALSDSGDVYLWGWNESGQLGFPTKSESTNSIFNCLEHICQCPKKEMSGSRGQGSSKYSSASAQHSNIGEKKNSDNYVSFISRENNGNSIRHEEMSSAVPDTRKNADWSKEVVNVQASPKLLDFWNEDVCVVVVSCGDRHTLFQIDDGSVWSAGMNKYGQLGLGHTNSVAAPTQVPIKQVKKLYAGGWNSVFITTPGN